MGIVVLSEYHAAEHKRGVRELTLTGPHLVRNDEAVVTIQLHAHLTEQMARQRL